MEVTEIAMVCHQTNKAYCDVIGDHTQPDWTTAPQWQVESVINGVQFHLNNPNSKPEDSHNNWLEEKRLAGWKYGEVKDVNKKEHPCFVEYDKLPEAQKIKDKLFIVIVRILS